MIILTPKHVFKFPIEGKNITPDIFAEKLAKEIADLEVWEGNRKRSLGELFDIKDDRSASEEFTIKIEGDVSKVRNIGFRGESHLSPLGRGLLPENIRKRATA